MAALEEELKHVTDTHADEITTLTATKHACLTKIERLRAQRDGLGQETQRLTDALSDAQADAKRLADDATAMSTVRSELEARCVVSPTSPSEWKHAQQMPGLVVSPTSPSESTHAC